ncbi:unnamed protein product [Arabidopsis halleri]
MEKPRKKRHSSQLEKLTNCMHERVYNKTKKKKKKKERVYNKSWKFTLSTCEVFLFWTQTKRLSVLNYLLL